MKLEMQRKQIFKAFALNDRSFLSRIIIFADAK